MRARLVPITGLVILLAGCESASRREAAGLTGGDPGRGASAISRYGCGACHTIPGIAGAHGLVGPTLSNVAARQYIGGSLTNGPVNMEHWIQDPHSINQQTEMPNVGVTASDAADIAAYLYSLK